MKCTRVLLLGVYLAHELLGATVPQPVWEKARDDSGVRRLARHVYEQLEDHSDATPGMLPRAMFRLRSRDRIADGIRHLTRLTLSPTEHDRHSARLPGALAPFYIVARPWRLLREYGWGLRRKPRRDLGIYDSTPPEVVDRMLALADVQSGDVLYDLGCGDGRIVIAAAERYGIRAVGVDVGREQIAEAQANARRHRVEHLVRFLQLDAKSVDFSEATVITLYLSPEGSVKLRDGLQSSLEAGARIVSRNDRIYGMAPERSAEYVFPDGTRTSLYLWKMKNDGDDSRPRSDSI
jgi:SAM-dependent methyltransferase